MISEAVKIVREMAAVKASPAGAATKDALLKAMSARLDALVAASARQGELDLPAGESAPEKPAKRG